MDNNFSKHVDTRSISSMIDPKTGKFDEKLDMDVATQIDIDRTNNDLVKYLNVTGDEVAAKRVEYLMQHQESTKSKQKVNPVWEELLRTNREILTSLRRIYDQNRIEKAPTIKSSAGAEKTPGIVFSERPGVSQLSLAGSKSELPKTSSVGGMLEKYALPAVSTAGRALSIAGSTLAVGAAAYGGWELGSYINKKYLTDKEGNAVIGTKVANEYTKYKHAEEFQKEGLIKHNIIGDSEISNWEKVRSLNPWTIQELINVDDWSPKTVKKLEQAKASAVARLKEEHSKRKEVKTPGLSEKEKPGEYVIKYINEEGPETSNINNTQNYVDMSTVNTSVLNKSTIQNLTNLGEEYKRSFGEKLVVTSDSKGKNKERNFTISGSPANIKKAESAGMFKKHGFSSPTISPIKEQNITVQTKTKAKEPVKAENMALQTKAKEPVKKQAPVRAKKVSKSTQPIQSNKEESTETIVPAKEVASSKEKKENATNSVSANLNKQMIIYDSKKESEAKQNVLEQTTRNNINMINKQEPESLFGLFSQG